MRSFVFALVLALVAPMALAQQDISHVNASIQTEAGSQYGNLETINGSIQVAAGVKAGAVETVNGSITIADQARIDGAETVNGAIRIGAGVVIKGDLETVSGNITVGTGSQVGDDIEAVNGSIEVTGAEVSGNIENVNGKISLLDTRVGGHVETANGDILIGRGSHVHGKIVVHKSRGFSLFSFGNSTPPKVTIEAEATVEGPLVFEREVELHIDPEAHVAHPEPVER